MHCWSLLITKSRGIQNTWVDQTLSKLGFRTAVLFVVRVVRVLWFGTRMVRLRYPCFCRRLIIKFLTHDNIKPAGIRRRLGSLMIRFDGPKSKFATRSVIKILNLCNGSYYPLVSASACFQQICTCSSTCWIIYTCHPFPPHHHIVFFHIVSHMYTISFISRIRFEYMSPLPASPYEWV